MEATQLLALQRVLLSYIGESYATFVYIRDGILMLYILISIDGIHIDNKICLPALNIQKNQRWLNTS